MPSPLWRYVAATRRVGVLAFSGDRDGAIELAHRASELALDLLPPEEVSGLEAGGDPVDAAAVRHPRPRRPAGPTAGDRVASARSRCCSCRSTWRWACCSPGTSTRGAAWLDQWAPLAEQGLQGLEGPGTVAFLARLVITTGAAEHAPLLRQGARAVQRAASRSATASASTRRSTSRWPSSHCSTATSRPPSRARRRPWRSAGRCRHRRSRPCRWPCWPRPAWHRGTRSRPAPRTTRPGPWPTRSTWCSPPSTATSTTAPTHARDSHGIESDVGPGIGPGIPAGVG